MSADFLGSHCSGLLIYSTCLNHIPANQRESWSVTGGLSANQEAGEVQVRLGDMVPQGVILKCNKAPVCRQRGPAPEDGLYPSWPISEALKHSDGWIPNSWGSCLLLSRSELQLTLCCCLHVTNSSCSDAVRIITPDRRRQTWLSLKPSERIYVDWQMVQIVSNSRN